MSEKREKRERLNQRLRYANAFEQWLKREPPMFPFFWRWRKWKLERPTAFSAQFEADDFVTPPPPSIYKSVILSGGNGGGSGGSGMNEKTFLWNEDEKER